MLRAGLYIRVSTEEQALHGGSIEAQHNLLTEYCEKNGIKIVDYYHDEGVSAGKPYRKRPAMVRLLKDVEAGKIDIILITKLDRWFRNVKEYYKVQEILEKNHVEWKTILEDYDTTTANGRMVIGIMLSIAQQERERTSERIKVVFDSKRKQGISANSVSSNFGYIKVNRDGKTVIEKNPETKEIWEGFYSVLSRTKNYYKAKEYLDEHGILINLHTIRSYIKRGVYITGSYKGVDNFCEPYISKNDWLELIDKYRGLKYEPTHTKLFVGLIRCPNCGNRMVGNSRKYTKTNGMVSRYQAYVCSNNRGKGGCTFGRHLSESKIEKALIDNLAPLVERQSLEIEMNNEAKKKRNTNVPALREKLRRTTLAYMDGNLSDDEYKQLSDNLKQKIKEAEACETPSVDLARVSKIVTTSNFRETYDAMTRDEKQEFWRGIIENTVMDDDYNIKSITFIA